LSLILFYEKHFVVQWSVACILYMRTMSFMLMAFWMFNLYFQPLVIKPVRHACGVETVKHVNVSVCWRNEILQRLVLCLLSHFLLSYFTSVYFS
jgi:hypothetical protein